MSKTFVRWPTGLLRCPGYAANSSRDKPAALQLVRENYGKYDPSFEVIEDARQVAKELLEILTATQCGLFACLAEIEGEEPDDDPDDRVAA